MIKLLGLDKRNVYCWFLSVGLIIAAMFCGELVSLNEVTNIKASQITISPLVIFINNLLVFTIYFIAGMVVPPFGIILALRTVFEIGNFHRQVATIYDISALKVLSIGMIHGFGELIVISVIIMVGIEVTIYWYKYFHNSFNIEPNIYFRANRSKYLRLYIASCLVLFVSAILEKYVSNQLFLSMIGG